MRADISVTANPNTRLIENLAKLMCTQEYVYRRNVNYAESMREKVCCYPSACFIANLGRRGPEKKTKTVRLTKATAKPLKLLIVLPAPLHLFTHCKRIETPG
jgi:hypothetical protein